MKFISSYHIVIAILLFTLFTILAHIFAPTEYSISKNAISALGAQGYDKKILMQLAFLSFGIVLSTGIIFDQFGWRELPLLIFALSMVMVGIFCAKPFDEQAGFTYSGTEATIHVIFSRIAALSFWMAVLFKMIFSAGLKLKRIHFAFLIVLAVIGLLSRIMPLKNDIGLVQRILFLISFVWLIKYYKLQKTPYDIGFSN